MKYKEAGKERLLLICPFFAPITSPRSIRWYHFSHYLAKKGFQVDVLADDPKSLNCGLDNKFSLKHRYIRVNYINGNIIKCIPNKEKCKKNKIFLTLKRIIDEIRGALYYPDSEMFWAIKVYGHISKHRNMKEYGYLITVSNPISSLLVGYQIRKKHNLKWICDLGDPWTFNPFTNRGAIKRKIDRVLEKKIVERADRIVVTTEQTRFFFANEYPKFKNKFVVISQGYDPKLYIKAKRSPFIDKKRLNLVYTGRLYKNGRDGIELLYAIKGLGSYKRHFYVLLAGKTMLKFEKYIKRLHLKKTVNYIGHLSLNEVASLQKSCDVLLQFGNDSKVQLPGKIFEYIGAGKPILGIYYNNYDIGKKIIEEQSLGLTCINERQRLKSVLIKLIKLWENGELNNVRTNNRNFKCDWDSNANKFYNLLLEIKKMKDSKI